MTHPCPCCGHQIQIVVSIEPAPNPPMVQSPARCKRCNVYYPLQGPVVGRCPCGGDLQTLHGAAIPPPKAAA